MPAHSWIEHTGELELELEAETEEDLFAEAAVALGELLASHEPGGGDESEGEAGRDRGEVVVEVAASAPDRPALLAEWLGELVFLAETQGLVARRVGELRLSPGGIEASVHGRRGAPPHLVKAVTYHRLEMRSAGGSWRGRAVLDV